jgi:hypothetical protein
MQSLFNEKDQMLKSVTSVMELTVSLYCFYPEEGGESITVLPDILQTTFSIQSSAKSSKPAITATVKSLYI